jgi:hypothetical protein
MGVAVFGNTLDETVQFDRMAFYPGPSLSIRREGEMVVLSWLTGFAGYELESSVAPEQSAGWTPVDVTVVSADGISEVTVPIAETQQFFRLAN